MSAYLRSRANTFAIAALERMSEQRDDVHWIARQSLHPASRYLLLCPQGRALASADQSSLLLLDPEQRSALLPNVTSSFLGSTDTGEHFLLSVDAATAAQVAATLSAQFLDLRSAGMRFTPFQASLFAYAQALAHWQLRSRFCSHCGAATLLESAGHKARCTETTCAAEHFPRTDPAIIVIVSCGDACLLGRQPGWSERRYSTLAGFVEPGETLEEAVRREVFEEAGVRVIDCDYHSSQPWPFPASIMLGFTATATDTTIRVGSELADARWFSVDDLKRGLAQGELVLSSPLSISYRLIEHWLRAKAGLELSSLAVNAS